MLKKSFLPIGFIFVIYLPLNAQVIKHGTGLLPAKPEFFADKGIKNPVPGAGRPIIGLPKSYSLSEAYLPVPGDQGSQGSCTAWAICYGARTFLHGYNKKIPVNINARLIDSINVFSPSFLYNLCKTDNICGEGIYYPKILQSLVDTGDVPFHYFGFDEFNCSRKPNPETLAFGNKYAVASYAPIYVFGVNPPLNSNSLDIVKKEIVNNNPLLLGVHLDSKFMSFYPWISPNLCIWDTNRNDLPIDSNYHAMLCVGYDNNLGAFKVLNSWGGQFGNNGYFWIKYTVFEEVVHEIYKLNDVPNSLNQVFNKNMSTNTLKVSKNVASFSMNDSTYTDINNDNFRFNQVTVPSQKDKSFINIIDTKKNKTIYEEVVEQGTKTSFIYDGKVYTIDVSNPQKVISPLLKKTLNFKISKEDLKL